MSWNDLWDLLPDRRRAGGGWEPPAPLILAAWWEATDDQKQERLSLHIKWAAEHQVLEKVAVFLRSLPEDKWYHAGD